MTSSPEVYNQYAENYMSGNDKLEKYHDYRISTFRSYLSDINTKDLHILDYGCGDGSISELISGKYTGIDPSSEMIRLAQGKYSHKFVCGGINTLKETLEREDIGVVICLNTLPYMSESEVSEFFQACSQHQCKVIVSHTNELLDLFSLNRYTVEHRASLLSEHPEALEEIESFKALLSNANHPKPASQVDKRFGTVKVNTSERDTVTKTRVDPFSWPTFIEEKYGFTSSNIQPIRIFALPPSVLEGTDKTFNLLHSNYFDTLPNTYKLLFCSQFRITFFPK